MGLLDTGRNAIINGILKKKDEMDMILNNPARAGRRALLNKAANSLAKQRPELAKAERKIATIVEDLDEIENNKDTLMTRREFMEGLIKRGMSRQVMPDVMGRVNPNSVGKYPAMKRLGDVLDNAPDSVEMQRRAAARKAAKEAREAAAKAAEEADSRAAVRDMLEYSYMAKIASFKKVR